MDNLNVPQLPVVRLNKSLPENDPDTSTYFNKYLFVDRNYLVLAEMEDTKHYILLDMMTGTILPGIHEIWRWERVPREDL